MSEELQNKEIAAELEALLFVSGEPIDLETIASVLECGAEDINAGLGVLENRLNEVRGGLCLLRAPEGVQLVTAEKHAPMIDRFLKGGMREQLSPAAAETLAIVAYRGPIHRAGVESIRGVNCSFSLRQLAMRGLIDRFPSEKDSRIFLYRINAKFLRHLGLVKPEDLPDYQKFRQHEGMTNLERMAEVAARNTETEEHK